MGQVGYRFRRELIVSRKWTTRDESRAVQTLTKDRSNIFLARKLRPGSWPLLYIT